MTLPTAIIDSHCHYNLEPFYPDWQASWKTAQSAGVFSSVVVGTDEVTSQRACEIAAQDPLLLAAVGIHPSEAGVRPTALSASELSQLLEGWRAVGPVSAVGETGLDYYRLSGSESEISQITAKQKIAFQSHLTVAAKESLPVLIHVRDTGETAYKDVMEILSPWADQLTIVLHCFSGPSWYLEKAVQLGCYISFAGNITYPNAENLRTHLSLVPKDRLLVETDSPFLPPQAHRGQPCLPSYIAETVAYMETELGVDPAQLVNNARRIFTTIPSSL